MPIPIIMPKLGLTMEEGTIVRWLKGEGETINKGEAILEVMTDKATVEVEAPGSGILGRILRREGEAVPITEIIGFIVLPGEDPATLRDVSEGEVPPLPTPEPAMGKGGRRPASPAARRLATELGVELEAIEGTGPGGRIVEEDVRRAAEAKAGPVLAAPPQPLAGLAKIAAERMAKSAATAAHYTLFSEVDVMGVLKYREDFSARGQKVSLTAVVVAAVARALREHPSLNVTLTPEGIIFHRDVNIGVAVDIPEGLVVPVIQRADRKDLPAIQAELDRLVEAARAGRLRPADLEGGRFTVSNLGMFDVDAFTMIINQPESAILGMGRIREKPVAIEDGIHIRPMMVLSLTADHRVINGGPAARFLACVARSLAAPNF